MSGLDISFSDEDLRGLEVQHNDFLYHRLLPQYSLPFHSEAVGVQAFSKSEVRRPMEQTIWGNLGEELKSMGKITVNVTAGERPRFRTFMVEFLVMDYASAYNIILGTKAIMSIYHLLIRFRTDAGIGEVRGSQQIYS